MHFLKKYLCVIFPPKIIQSISLKSKQNTFAIEMSKCFNFQAHIELNMPNVNRSHALPPILSTTPHQITKKGGRLVFALTGSLFITCKKEEQTFKKVIRKKDKNPKLQKFARFISRVIGLTSLPPYREDCCFGFPVLDCPSSVHAFSFLWLSFCSDHRSLLNWCMFVSCRRCIMT